MKLKTLILTMLLASAAAQAAPTVINCGATGECWNGECKMTEFGFGPDANQYFKYTKPQQTPRWLEFYHATYSQGGWSTCDYKGPGGNGVVSFMTGMDVMTGVKGDGWEKTHHVCNSTRTIDCQFLMGS